jgi:hypothetical protein
LSNVLHGIETWGAPWQFVVRNSVFANNGATQILFGGGEGGNMTIRNSLMLAQGGVSIGVHSDRAYHDNLEIYDSEILGAASGVTNVRTKHIFKNVTLQNRINFDWRHSANRSISMSVLEDIISIALPGEPLQHFATGQMDPSDFLIIYDKNVGYRVILKNWQQEGRNYAFYRPQALRSTPAVGWGVFPLPESGLTNGELWDKYGISIDGGPVPESAAPFADSDGYVVEFMGDAPQVELPVPRWILMTTYVAPGVIDFLMVYTGTVADSNMVLEIDGQLLNIATYPQPALDQVWFRLRGEGSWDDPGEHTVRTWRTLNGSVIEGSEMVFQYFVTLS